MGYDIINTSPHGKEQFCALSDCGHDTLARRYRQAIDDEERKTWVYDSLTLSHCPRRIDIQVFVVHQVLENIICLVEESSALCNPSSSSTPAGLFAVLAAAPDPCEAARDNSTIQFILALARARYSSSSRPQFAHGLFAEHHAGEWYLTERLDESLLQGLKPTSQAIAMANVSRLPPCVACSELRNSTDLGAFFSPQTSKVEYRGNVYVGKHPRVHSRLHDDFAEVTNLLNLPRQHPNIVPPPCFMVTVSTSDSRICGFLLPYYSHGDLYQWAQELDARGELDASILQRWAIEIADAMKFLISCGEWHGDLKPDNILVDRSGRPILADFTKKFATVAFASPELLSDQEVTQDASGSLLYHSRGLRRKRSWLGLPCEWPLLAKEKSEVYAFGVLLLVLIRRLTLIDVYRKSEQAGSGYLDWSTTEEDLSSFPTITVIIQSCIRWDPTTRPTFHAIIVQLQDEY